MFFFFENEAICYVKYKADKVQLWSRYKVKLFCCFKQVIIEMMKNKIFREGGGDIIKENEYNRKSVWHVFFFFFFLKMKQYVLLNIKLIK